MTTKTISESPIWKEFEAEAKKRRRNPVKLALDLIKEQIEIWEDDAVELVRQYRREKRENAAS